MFFHDKVYEWEGKCKLNMIKTKNCTWHLKGKSLDKTSGRCSHFHCFTQRIITRAEVRQTLKSQHLHIPRSEVTHNFRKIRGGKELQAAVGWQHNKKAFRTATVSAPERQPLLNCPFWNHTALKLRCSDSGPLFSPDHKWLLVRSRL